MTGPEVGPVDDALRAEWQRLRAPADVVPKSAPPTDWRALARAARQGGLTWTRVELTEDGVVTVTEPVTVVVPWDDDPK